MPTYFYRDNSGREIGPFDLVTLEKFKQAGVINATTPVRLADQSEWKILRELLPASPAAQIPQQSSNKTFNWIWAGLAVAGVIVFLASRSTVEHAAEAEKCFRTADGLALQRDGLKIINFKAISGDSSFIEKNNFGTPQHIECYKIKYTAKLEFENDTPIAHKGDWEEISSTVIGIKAGKDWTFENSRDIRDTDFINASSSSLLSELRNMVNLKVRQADAVSRARVTAAQTDIKAGIKTALDSYEADNGFYPKSLQDLIQQPSNARNWKGPYFDPPQLPVDPWGNPYVYYYPGKHNSSSYDLLSVGPDGNAGTDDDIGNWAR
jgi:general secretion pathway protein G